MTLQKRLFKLIEKHLGKAGVQRYFHHFGPKKFTTAELILGLVLRQKYQLSYRATSEFLEEYYDLNIHWTTLQKAAMRLPLKFWQDFLQTTIPAFVYSAAIDSTGYTRSNPSQHYRNRVDGMTPRISSQASIMVDTDTRCILSCRVRVNPAHDVKDVKSLINQSKTKPWTVVMDKGYDSETVHDWLDEQGVWSIAPTRKNARRGWFRKKLRDHFPESEYAYRNIVEAVFRSLKARYTGTVRAKKARTVRSEVMIRCILHNLRVLGAIIIRLFLQTRQ